MRTTAAEISLHALNDFRSGGVGIFSQNTMGFHDHAGSAEPTLEGIVLNKGLLQWMEIAIFFQTFNSGHFRSVNVLYACLT